jgi:His/Glu/Gln/Arg/opine family amino acid ABC transporter permease subunit
VSTTLALIIRYWPGLLGGALTTIELALIAWIGGLVIGTAIGVWRATQRRRAVRGGIAIAALALSSVPVMVYLLWAHYPLQAALGISIPPFVTAATVFLLYNALAVAEVVRNAIEALPLSYGLAARTTGVPRGLYLRSVAIPLALRAVLPSYLVSQVTTLHLTLFASLISVDELFRVTQRINAIEYDAVGIFSLLAIFYFVLSFPMLLLARAADRHLAKIGLDR